MSGITIPKNWRNLILKTDITETVATKKNLFKAIRNSVEYIEKYCNNIAPVLCLSGGVDSSIIAVLAKESNLPIQCLTIGSNDQHPDVVHAKLLVERFKFLSHTVIYPKVPVDNGRDMYEILFKTCHELNYRFVICCDTIDEQLGGYWFHQKPQSYLEKEGIVSDDPKKTVFKTFWDKLIPNHLSIMQKWSKYYGITVFLPYLTKDILMATRSFTLEERVNDFDRKIPLKDIARRLSIPEEIITRPKKGLVDALKIF